jgi:uncharacterized protein YbgA (DUF1722 family)
MTPSQEKLMREINKKLDQLLDTKLKKWVSASEVMKITGWNKDQLRNKRDQGLIEYERNGRNGWKYLLETVPQLKVA